MHFGREKKINLHESNEYLCNQDKGLFTNDIIFSRGGLPLPPWSCKITFLVTSSPVTHLKVLWHEIFFYSRICSQSMRLLR